MAFIGKWKFDRAENMTEFLLAAGAPPEAAQEAGTLSSIVECSKDGSNYTFKTQTDKGSLEHTFQLGSPFELEIPGHGKKFTVVASDEGGKLVFKGTGGEGITETREIKGNTMIVTVSKPGVSVVGKRILNRV
ncbi:fatty acid-binding protein 2, liver-like [Ptychodera flava]|uniref:fatty acid-binding protein 2, liver-like n=1 Tax=Ptychodera flava TaxID=63121 RepID=UPI003969D337